MNFYKLSSIPSNAKVLFEISRGYSLLSSDAYIASFAKRYGITNIATNDSDFERVEWLKVWKP